MVETFYCGKVVIQIEHTGKDPSNVDRHHYRVTVKNAHRQQWTGIVGASTKYDSDLQDGPTSYHAMISVARYSMYMANTDFSSKVKYGKDWVLNDAVIDDDGSFVINRFKS